MVLVVFIKLTAGISSKSIYMSQKIGKSMLFLGFLFLYGSLNPLNKKISTY